MNELPYILQCILAAAQCEIVRNFTYEVPSFIDIIIRHAVGILGAM